MSFLFNRFASGYDYFMDKTGLASEGRLLEHIGDVIGMKAADIGGGTGNLSVLLANSKAEVTIIDHCESMTSIAKKKDSRINVIAAVAEKIPIADNTFDIVCMKDCLHHVVNQEKALQEAVRILKLNGKLIIMDFNPLSLKSKIIYAFERVLG